MQFLSAEALLLDVVDLHEYDRVVTFLTREWGKQRGVARGARRKYSRFGGQLQPLAKVRITWVEKAGRELAQINAVELERSARRLQQDLEGILLGGYLADHLVEFAQENEASDHLYRLLDSTLEALLSGIDRELAARYFEAWVLRLAGVFPAPGNCPSCGRSLRRSGAVVPPAGEGLLCRRCGASPGAFAVPDKVLDFMQRIGTESLQMMAGNPPGAKVLEGARSLSARVRRDFLQHELKSYRVMEETLARARGAGG